MSQEHDPIRIKRNAWASRVFGQYPAKRYFYIPGGRMSSKTTEAVNFMLRLACQPRLVDGVNVPAVFVMSRWIAKNIDQSLKPALEKAMNRMGVRHQFEYNKATKEFTHKIHGHRIIPIGLHNSLDRIVGIDEFYFWLCDESQFPPEEIIEKVKDTMARVPGHIIIMIGNLPSYSVAFYVIGRREAEVSDYVHFEIINYDQNAFLDEDAIDRIATVLATNADRYRHEYLAEPRTSFEGQVYQFGKHWIEGNLDAEVEKLGIMPRYAGDWGGNQAGGGESPSVFGKLYAYDSPQHKRKVIYLQKTRHAYGLEDRHNAAMLCGPDTYGKPDGSLRWDVPNADQYGTAAIFDGIMDPAEIHARTIWTDHREASEKSLRDAGAKPRKAPKPKGCEVTRTEKIRNEYLIVVNYEKIPDTDIRECEQWFVDAPGYLYLEYKHEPGSYDFMNFKDGSDHACDMLAYGISDIVFPDAVKNQNAAKPASSTGNKAKRASHSKVRFA